MPPYLQQQPDMSTWPITDVHLLSGNLYCLLLLSLPLLLCSDQFCRVLVTFFLVNYQFQGLSKCMGSGKAFGHNHHTAYIASGHQLLIRFFTYIVDQPHQQTTFHQQGWQSRLFPLHVTKLSCWLSCITLQFYNFLNAYHTKY